MHFTHISNKYTIFSAEVKFLAVFCDFSAHHHLQGAFLQGTVQRDLIQNLTMSCSQLNKQMSFIDFFFFANRNQMTSCKGTVTTKFLFYLSSNQVIFDMTVYQNTLTASSLSVNKYICLSILGQMCPSQSKTPFKEDW